MCNEFLNSTNRGVYMAIILKSGQRTTYLTNTVLRSFSSIQDTKVRTARAVERSMKPVYGQDSNSSGKRSYSKIVQENYHRSYSTVNMPKKPQGDWVGGDKVGGDKVTQGPFSSFTKAGRDIWNIKIAGVGAVVIVALGVGGYFYCEKASDHELCDTLRDKIGIKKK